MKITNNSHLLSLILLILFFALITGCEKDKDEPYQVLTDIDGNVYQTVKIGDQVWMAENLRTTRYRNGDSIYHFTSNASWVNTTLGAWCNYDNDSRNDKIYGKLYNGYAVYDSRNIAPEGWHVPTAAEWWALNLYVSQHLGQSGSLTKALAGPGYWDQTSTLNTPGNDLKSNNASGFNGLPGGFRTFSGAFGYASLEHDAYWWSGDYMIWNLQYNNTDINALNEGNLKIGCSVRCIKDIELTGQYLKQ